MIKGSHHTEESKNKLSEFAKTRIGSRNPFFGKTHSENTRKKISAAATTQWSNPESRKEMSEIKKGYFKNPKNRQKFSDSKKKYYAENPEATLKNSEAIKKYYATNSDAIQKNRESQLKAYVDRCWYGDVTYNDNGYCEKWTEDLRERIRKYWNYKSVLSGKTKVENNNRSLSCHHVYYQKKACCIWDEDTKGYYAFVDRKKYYITGDPNKFVTLTSAEHTLVGKKDKLKWIKFFEDLIEQQGGISYLPKAE